MRTIVEVWLWGMPIAFVVILFSIALANVIYDVADALAAIVVALVSAVFWPIAGPFALGDAGRAVLGEKRWRT